MKKARLFAAVVCLVVSLSFVGTAGAQTLRPQVVGAGSSALFPSVAIGAVTADPITKAAAYCGTNIWSGASPIAMGVDNRAATIPGEPGNIWVAWDGKADGSTLTTVCTYLAVDSIVGNRLFFSQAINGGIQTNGYISLNTNARITPGANKVNFVLDTVQPTTCDANGNQGAGTGPCGLPPAVYNIVNGANFNIAFTDIRPEDAMYATGRAFCGPRDAALNCLGYTLGSSYAEFASTFSSGIANVVPFSIPPGGVPGSATQGAVCTYLQFTCQVGVDPISSLTIPAATTIPIGADPVLVIVNITDKGTGGLGSVNPTNVSSHSLSEIFSGLSSQICSISGAVNTAHSGCLAPHLLTIVEREALSGTYNTFEWQTVRSQDNHYGNGQELGNPTPTAANTFAACNGGSAIQYPSPANYIPPANQVAPYNYGTCANPLNALGLSGNFRLRAIGTGEMVAAVNSANNPDSIGYAFWSLGTFGGKSNIKYLAVDEADPLFPGYSVADGGQAGAMPTGCTGYFNAAPAFSCTYVPTFDGVQNGSYRIFSLLRGVVDNAVQSYQVSNLSGTATPAGLIQAAQDQAALIASPRIPDFVPFQYCPNAACASFTLGLNVFRSHYGVAGPFPDNGIANPWRIATGNPTSPEGGGDMMGSPVPVAVELDHLQGYGPSGELFNIFE